MELRAGDGEESSSEILQPKVKEELDRLNQASEDINNLENELDEARSKFSSTRNESTQQLNALAQKIKTGVIKKARPYYEAKEKARKAQEEALKAARQYQSANGIHRAAKETISLAEQKLFQEDSTRVLTSEWQEMFNHATIRLADAEKEKRRSKEEHETKSRIFSEAEKHMQVEEKKHKRSIAKAKPYFERKAELQTKLEMLKVAVEALQNAVSQSKKKYSEALSNLEAISNQVHAKRSREMLLYLPREPGVGAENDVTDAAGIPLRTSFDVPDTPNTGRTFDFESCSQDDEDDDGSCDPDDSDSSVDFVASVHVPNVSSDQGGSDSDLSPVLCHKPGAPSIHRVVSVTKSVSSLESITEDRPLVLCGSETFEPCPHNKLDRASSLDMVKLDGKLISGGRYGQGESEEFKPVPGTSQPTQGTASEQFETSSFHSSLNLESSSAHNSLTQKSNTPDPTEINVLKEQLHENATQITQNLKSLDLANSGQLPAIDDDINVTASSTVISESNSEIPHHDQPSTESNPTCEVFV